VFCKKPGSMVRSSTEKGGARAGAERKLLRDPKRDAKDSFSMQKIGKEGEEKTKICCVLSAQSGEAMGARKRK